jgi:hypothetical protein
VQSESKSTVRFAGKQAEDKFAHALSLLWRTLKIQGYWYNNLFWAYHIPRFSKWDRKGIDYVIEVFRDQIWYFQGERYQIPHGSYFIQIKSSDYWTQHSTYPRLQFVYQKMRVIILSTQSKTHQHIISELLMKMSFSSIGERHLNSMFLNEIRKLPEMTLNF